MKKNLRKLTALLLMLVTVLGISVTANAAPNYSSLISNWESSENKVARFQNYGATTNNDGIDKITFDVSLTNNTLAGSSPAQTFDYEVDFRPTDAVGYSDPHPQVTFNYDDYDSADTDSTTATFPSLASGATDTRRVRLHIAMDPDNTPASGVYHYVISQTLHSYNVSAGFTDENGEDQGDGIVTAYMMTVYVDSYGKVTQAILQDTNGNKLKGFEIQYTSPEPTYRVKLEKTSVRGTVPTDTPFLFDVKIDLPTGTDASLLSVKIGDQAVNFLSDEDGDDLSTVVTNVEVKVGHYVEITGLPQAATVFVYEHDDGVFEVTSKVEGMANTGEKLDAGNKDRKWLTYGTIQYNDGVITYNNEKADISLTGVSLRYAPYMAMMGAGLAVVGLSKTRRKEEEI